jgi:DNA-binding FadR family transcriptional regulator
MTDFQDLLHLFDQFDIQNEAQLKKAMGESGSERYEYDPWAGTGEPSSFGGRLTVALSQLDLDTSSSRESLGIQQYSLAAKKDLATDDVTKALFLSRRATILTSHRIEIHDHHDDYAGGDEQIVRWEKTLCWDPEFFREIYTFRKAIERGQLRLLPNELIERRTQSRTSGEEEVEPRELIGVLEEINTSNALAMKRRKTASPDLIDRVLRSYRRKEQLVHLASLDVPWIQGISLEDVLRVKDDHQDALDRFQAAYHEAIAEHIRNYGTVDFRAISDQLREDLIQPQLNALESQYKRTVTRHRSLAVAGATVAFVPLGIAVVSQQFFNSGFGDAGSMIPAGMAGAISSFLANKIGMKSSAGDMEQNTFYVLWLLGRERRTDRSLVC